MPVAPSIIHIESPYTIRNLREKLQSKHRALLEDFRSIDPNNCADVARLQGHLNGLSDALLILAELEEKDGRTR